MSTARTNGKAALLAGLFAAATWALFGCGGNVVVDGAGGSTGSGPSSTGGVTSSAGSGCHPSPAGDCATDADCGQGSCAPLTPGGYRVCLAIPPEASSCTSPPTPMDQCCTSAACPGGARCYPSAEVIECWGGPAMPFYNLCVSDDCASDADCIGKDSPRICAPAGAFAHPVRACVTAYCRTDADCTAQPCGACVTVTQPCCGVPAGLACVYPGGCSKNADCNQGNVCNIDPITGTGRCTPPMPCPV